MKNIKNGKHGTPDKLKSGHRNRPEKEFKRQEGAQSLHRAISLIREVFKYNDRGVRLSRLAKNVDLPVTTAHRILNVLAEERLIAHDPVTKHYHLGIELFLWGAAANQYNLRDWFRNALERIAEETQDTVYMLIRTGNDSICIDRVVGEFPVQVLNNEIGNRRCLGIGAGGLALIAFLPDDQVEAIIAANAMQYPKFMGRTVDDVRDAVAKSRELGYGLGEKNTSRDTIGVGVPIRDARGEIVAAIAVAAIERRMETDRQREIARLIEAEINAVNFGSLK